MENVVFGGEKNIYLIGGQVRMYFQGVVFIIYICLKVCYIVFCFGIYLFKNLSICYGNYVLKVVLMEISYYDI